MLPDRETFLSRYHYDARDQLIDSTPSTQPPIRRFYLKDRLATEIQDAVQRSIMQHDDQLLAQQQRQNGNVESRLLNTDQQRSVLNVLDAARPRPIAYSPYGHRPPENGLLSLLGFNGERPDPVTGCYLLGNGYRAFNPVLMRFNSPDSWSPFGEGGFNAYAYCVGDPVNRIDPTGHIGNPIKGFLNLLGRTPSSVRANRAYEAGTASPINLTARTEPPPHSQSSTNITDSAPPGYFDNSNVAPVYRASSEQNLGPPPLYSGDIQPPMDPFRHARLQQRLDLATAHLHRVEDATRRLVSTPSAIQQTIDSLRHDINTYRDRLDLPPLYTSNRDLRESL
ncbi:hypothetical protein D3C71_876020 [compost metagenome]